MSPPGRKLVQCKWVFKTKFSVDGSPLKYKAILVAKGYSQVCGVEYNETFSLVAKMDSIRLALAIAASKQWEVHHMDVKCVDVFITSKCIHLCMLCIVTQFLFRDVSIMYLSHVVMPRCSDREDQ